jgi:hypothetical protein
MSSASTSTASGPPCNRTDGPPVITPNGDGEFAVDLPPELRTYIAEALQGLRSRLMTDTADPQLQRLFPAAYNNDGALNDEYQRLMRPELLESRLRSLDAVEQSIHAETVTRDDLNAWMQSVNSLRLVIGTSLDVGEEGLVLPPDDPRYPDLVLYELMSQLLMLIIDALYGGGGDGDPSRRKRFWRR